MSDAMQPEATPRCPLCGTPATVEFLRRSAVPVHQNLLTPSRAEASSVARGTLAMRICGACRFVFNAAFDASLLNYGSAYDNSQTFSPCFAGYVDGLVQRIVEECGVANCQIVEVGCGKGTFLTKLIDYPGGNNRGIGFDPTYQGPTTLAEGRLRFQRSFYGVDTREPADAVVCRHVIEHVADPRSLLRDVRAAIGDQRNARVFFETPCVEWILRGQVVWDFFYEHCSLFTAHSLASAFASEGFPVNSVETVFGEQYLWLEAGIPGRPAVLPHRTDLVQAAIAFGQHEREQIRLWRAQLAAWSARGRIAVWGAGAKGVTFCNLVDPDARALHAVVDVNPGKQGKFIPGTGHRVLTAAQAAEEIEVFLVLNPNYVAEIERGLRRLGSSALVVDLMNAKESIHEASA